MPFREWSRRLVYAVRRKLLEPVEVKAREDGSVTLRLGGRVATIKEEAGTRAVSFAGETMTEREGDLAESVVEYFSSRRAR